MSTAFYEIEFFALAISSVLLPVGIYVVMLLKKSISQWTVLVLRVGRDYGNFGRNDIKVLNFNKK